MRFAAVMAAKFVASNFEPPGIQGFHSLEMASRMVYRVVSVLSPTRCCTTSIEPTGQLRRPARTVTFRSSR